MIKIQQTDSPAMRICARIIPLGPFVIPGIRHPAFGISASISSMLFGQIDRTGNSFQGVGQ